MNYKSENFAPLVGFGDVLVHVNANQDAHLIYIVEERPQSEIARCTEKANHGIKVLDLRVIFEYALKLFHQSVPIPVGEEMGSDWYLYHTLSFCSARTICSERMGSNEEPRDTKKRRLALINVPRSSDNPCTKISPACASADAVLIRFEHVL